MYFVRYVLDKSAPTPLYHVAWSVLYANVFFSHSSLFSKGYFCYFCCPLKLNKILALWQWIPSWPALCERTHPELRVARHDPVTLGFTFRATHTRLVFWRLWGRSWTWRFNFQLINSSLSYKEGSVDRHVVCSQIQNQLFQLSFTYLCSVIWFPLHMYCTDLFKFCP